MPLFHMCFIKLQKLLINMNSTELLNNIETIEGHARLAYGKCRFIIEGI